MTDNAMFSKAQHGFRPGRSCVTQLLEVIESWTRILDAGGVVDALYADMDTLISDRKVAAGSGEWCRLKLVTSYKWDIAMQCIRATSISSIHQLYMPDDIMSSIKIFADDTKAYKDVQTDEDMLTLQKDVYALCDWSLN